MGKSARCPKVISNFLFIKNGLHNTSLLWRLYFGCRHGCVKKTIWEVLYHWMVAKSCTSWKRWFIPWFIGFQPSFWWCRISQPSTVSWKSNLPKAEANSAATPFCQFAWQFEPSTLQETMPGRRNSIFFKGALPQHVQFSFALCFHFRIFCSDVCHH